MNIISAICLMRHGNISSRFEGTKKIYYRIIFDPADRLNGYIQKSDSPKFKPESSKYSHASIAFSVQECLDERWIEE